jgi:hypothetical protein
MHIEQPPLPDRGLKLGIYKHYKGGFYRVVGEARHENTGDILVVYRSISRGIETGEGPMWVRPLDQFSEKVTITDRVGERQVSRFTYVSAT